MRCVRRCFKMLPTMLRPIFSKKSPGKMATLSSSYSYGRVWTGPEQLEDPRPQPTDKRILRVVVLVARAAGAVSLFLFALIALAWWHLFSVDVGDRTAVSGNGRGREKTFTVRMNTWRRNDLLKKSAEHFASCDCVGRIQIVWSDQENTHPPLTFFKLEARHKIEFEVHDTNSLNHRFNVTSHLPTDGVFSTDDDLQFPCRDLQFAFETWQSSPHSMVGFSPRMVTRDPRTDRYSYRSWRVVRWNGVYNVILTKCCFLHRGHLTAYVERVPNEVMDYIDQHRNCEDIAMAVVVAKHFGTPPLWVKGSFKEIGREGISAIPSHFEERGRCVDFFAQHFDGVPLIQNSAKVYPMHTGVLSWL